MGLKVWRVPELGLEQCQALSLAVLPTSPAVKLVNVVCPQQSKGKKRRERMIDGHLDLDLQFCKSYFESWPEMRLSFLGFHLQSPHRRIRFLPGEFVTHMKWLCNSLK